MSKSIVDIVMVREHAGDTLSSLVTSGSGDLNWSDEEIISAMEGAARAYNSLPPHGVSSVTPTCMPADTELFLDGAVAVLFERKVRNLALDRQAFDAGGISTDPDGKVIEALVKLSQELRAKFRAEGVGLKATINQRHCWGRVG